MSAKMVNANVEVIENIYFDSDWQKILKQRNNIRIPTKNPLSLDNYVHDQPDSIWEIIDRDGINVHDNDNFLKEIREDPSRVLDHPSDIYFLDNDIKAECLDNNSGVFVSTGLSAKADSLKINWRVSLNQDDSFSWNSFFSNQVVNKKIPSNSLIIVDRYLLAHFSRGRDNLISFLDSLLPDELTGIYQLLIVFEEEPSLSDRRHNFMSINEVVSRLNNVVPSLRRPYEIVFEVLVINKANEWRTPEGKALFELYNATHSRRAYSNYFVIGADQGFSAVKKENSYSKSFFSQKIEFEALYYGIDNSYQDVNYLPFKTVDNFIAVISKFLNTGTPHCKYYKNGVLGDVHDICNRLLK